MSKLNKTNKETDIGVCREIALGVYCIEAGKGIIRSNVYFVWSGSSWVLIDAASANCPSRPLDHPPVAARDAATAG